MAANTVPIFIKSVTSGEGSIATGGVNPVEILAVGADGGRVDTVTVTASATTTAGRYQIVVKDGTTEFIVRDRPITAITVSDTVAPFSETVPLDMFLPAGYTVRAQLALGSVTIGASLSVVANGGDF